MNQNSPKRIALVSLILIGYLSTIRGFSLQAYQNSKSHYTIINPKNENQDIIIKAITHTDLDPCRFVDKRRILQIEGTNIQLELYSGNELLDLYGKPISPNSQFFSKNQEKITLKIVHAPTGSKLVQVK